jgi:hypothetical protein
MSIECPVCGHKNPADSLYCEECGFKLPMAPQLVTPPSPPPPPPPSVVAYVLRFKGGTFEVSDATRTFGRKDFAPYLSEDECKFISRKHFTITKEGDKFYIQDEGSTNGTKLNGVEIKGAGRKELKDGDKILVAETVELQFTIKK